MHKITTTWRAHVGAGLAGIGLLVVSPTVLAGLGRAVDDAVVSSPNTSVLIDVLANDVAVGSSFELINAHGAANGKAKAEGNKVRYTPNPGFTGFDTFKYNVFVDGNRQPSQATVTVAVGQGASVTLTGQVVDEPVPNARVTVLVGGYEFTAVANSQGRYTLDIASLQPDAFITMVAEGQSASGVPLTFYSVVGELARLVQEAGTDGVLTRDENNQVNITNLSTAQYVLLTDANNDQPVTSDEQLVPLTQSIQLDELLELAAVIKLVVDEGYSLPIGVTNIVELLDNRQALNAFINDIPDGVLDATVQEVASDPAITPAYIAGKLPAGYTMLVPSAPGTIRVGVGHNGVYTFQSSNSASQGVATVIDSGGPNDIPLQWALDTDGSLLITPSNGPVWDAPADETSGQCSSSAEYSVVRRFLSFRITRLQQGAGLDYLETVGTWEEAFTDLDANDSCVPPASGINKYPAKRLGFQPGSGELPFTAADLTGKRMLQYFSPAVLINQQQGRNPWGAAIFDFDAGTVLINSVSLAFTPTLNNGRIEFSLPDTVSGEVVHYSFARLQRDGRKGDGVLVRATRADGTPLAHYNLSAAVDGTLFSTASMPAEWRSGFDVSQFAGDGTVEFGFFIMLQPDGTGFQRTVNADGSISDSFKTSGWAVDAAGVMRLRSARVNTDTNGVVRPVCPASLPPGAACFDRRIRKWIPIAIDGDRIYVLEEFAEQFGPNGQQLLTAQRANFYQR